MRGVKKIEETVKSRSKSCKACMDGERAHHQCTRCGDLVRGIGSSLGGSVHTAIVLGSLLASSCSGLWLVFNCHTRGLSLYLTSSAKTTVLYHVEILFLVCTEHLPLFKARVRENYQKMHEAIALFSQLLASVQADHFATSIGLELIETYQLVDLAGVTEKVCGKLQTLCNKSFGHKRNLFPQLQSAGFLGDNPNYL